jgi:hypothetical protein
MKSSEIVEEKGSHRELGDDLRPEYDFSGGVRGKYAGRFSSDTVMVTLAPDVAAVFPDAESVNEALRLLLKTARNVAKHIAPAA